MSLDINLTIKTSVFDTNITHNLGEMAEAAGIYYHLWRPEEIGVRFASELIEPLTQGLYLLKTKPKKFETYNPKNGWGSYDVFVRFVEEYLNACIKNPQAEIEVDR